jgi:hypothetical protein
MFDFAVSYTQGATGLSPQIVSDDFVLFETGNDNESLGFTEEDGQTFATLIVPVEKAEALNINLDKMWLGVTSPSDGRYAFMTITHLLRIETAVCLCLELTQPNARGLSGMTEATLDILIAALMRA